MHYLRLLLNDLTYRAGCLVDFINALIEIVFPFPRKLAEGVTAREIRGGVLTRGAKENDATLPRNSKFMVYRLARKEVRDVRLNVVLEIGREDD